MNSKFDPLLTALEGLEASIKAATSDNRSIIEMTPSWNSPAVDRNDLALMTRRLYAFVEDRAPDEPSESDLGLVSALATRIKALQVQTVPQLFSGNGGTAVPVLVTSFLAMRAWMDAEWPEREKIDPSSAPFKLARQARALKARLDDAVGDLGSVREQIALIAEAHQAAEQLPADLEDLKAARARIGAANEQALADGRAITEKLDEIAKQLEAARASSSEADGYAKKSSEAYRFTTSHGLAASFDEKAKSLAASMWVWVGGLLSALGAVAYIGSDRVATLTAIVSIPDPRWGAVAINLVLSVVSVGAPLWFAWVATKQIGQRFRLSEDYGFKSSVAKAYEGYRREAISIDESFEAELFGIALERLREAPLRLVEPNSHGSPWHELLESTAFTDARRSVPDLPRRLTEYVRSLTTRSAEKASPEVKPEGGG